MSLSLRRALSNKTRIGYGLSVAAWLMFVVAAPVARAQQAAEELVAQKPFVSTVVEGLGVTRDKTGTPLAVAIVCGVNTPLEIVNLKTQKRLIMAEQRMDGIETCGQAYVTLPNRHVLVGTAAGYIYDVDPDKQTAVELTPQHTEPLGFTGATLGDDTVSYWLAQASGGSRMYSFNAQTGRWRDFGTVPTARGGVAYADKTVYLGSEGAGAAVFALNTESGVQTSFAIPGVPAASAVTVEAVVDGYLYASLASTPALTLVYDVKHAALVDQRPSLGRITAPLPQEVPQAKPVDPQPTTPQVAGAQTQATGTQPATESPNNTTTPPATGPSAPTTPSNNGQTQPSTPGNDTKPTQQPGTTNTSPETVTPPAGSVLPAQAPVAAPAEPQPRPVFFGSLSQYDPATKQTASKVNAQGLVPASACWIDETRCVVVSRSGRLGIVNTAGRSFKLLAPSPLTGGYHRVDFTVVGSDDTVFAASAVPGTAMLQLDRDKTMLRKLVGLPGAAFTSLASSNKTVVAGTDTGYLVRYSPGAQTTTPVFDAGVKVGSGSVSALAPAASGKLAYGLSQGGSAPTGAIGLYSVASGSVSLAPQVVLQNQTVGSLVYLKGQVFAGGISATGSAELVSYDTTRQAVVTRSVPVPGAKDISSLAVGPNGHIYGVAGSTLFEVDPQTLAVVNRHALSVTGQSGNLLFWQGKLLASVAGKIYQVNADTLSAKYLVGGSHVSVNSLGDMYYSRGAALQRMIAPRVQVAAVTKVQKASSSRFDFAAIDIRVRAGVVASFGLLLLSGLALRLHQRRVARAYYSLRR